MVFTSVLLVRRVVLSVKGSCKEMEKEQKKRLRKRVKSPGAENARAIDQRSENWSVLCKKGANEKRGSNSRVLAKLAEIVIVCDGDDKGKALRKLSLADGGDEGRSAVASRGEVGVADLLALLAHELRVDRKISVVCLKS